MGKNKCPLIIEFNGLPGSGKSTLSNRLLNKLQIMGIKAEQSDYFINSLNAGKYTKYLRLFKYGGVKVPIYLLSFLISIKPISIARIKYIKSIYLFYLIYKKYSINGDYDAIVVDQGIIQAIVSSVYLDKMDAGKLAELLNKLNLKELNYLVVDCISDELMSSKRINSRKLEQGRFDFMEIDCLRKNLEIQSSIFAEVRSCLNIKDIDRVGLDMRTPINTNTNILYEIVIKRISNKTNTAIG
ncbi:hypothetical protein QTL97_04985 [Sporosarcina thermotolerans]|uniref:Thymidylate kinase n=1 Tax=Sporosarcina thermotolerans TaxID=633404 RepID=A0AAW9A9B2_9BACL|nr:hypothetical protein [Sporosarcina thermotolerans]MDW0116278.1 hypothetical protein [Sporosarcina thermotolerans]WHT48250.1 hypothetical protein QNH10_19920 [Sporosarcina thermotolerans]